MKSVTLSLPKKKRKLNLDSREKKSLLFGSGASTEDTLISKIVDLVTEKLKSPEQKLGAGNNLLPPTAELVPSDETSPPLHFNNTIVKNDDNDNFGKKFF